MKRFSFIILGLLFIPLISYSQKSERNSAKASIQQPEKQVFPLQKSEVEWKALLSPEAYYILREKGTERAFTGAFWNNKEKGTYCCAGCGQALFSSEAKYNSGTGWPSYWKPITSKAVATEKDYAYGMTRVEVSCSNCGGHLGHVFSDGPRPTRLRYCINSASLSFEKKEKE